MILALLAVSAAACGSGDPGEQIGRIYDLKRDPTPANVERIRERLDDDDRDIRATALNALVTLGVEDSVAIARRALGDTDGFVRSTAAKLLGDVGGPDDAPALADVLRADPDAIARMRAAEALADIGGDDAAAALVLALDDPVEQVRTAAVKGVRALDAPNAIPGLTRLLLDDPVWEIRAQAAAALGETGGPQAVEALRAGLADENEFVRSAAANGLETAGAPVEPATDD